MLKLIIRKAFNKLYPNRKFTIEKIGKQYFACSHDLLSPLRYSLEGTYTYDQVQKINEYTKYHVKYGYCEEKGPVAVIGLSNQDFKWDYFEEVTEYGKLNKPNHFKFTSYSSEDAKLIGNYNVYGDEGFKELAGLVKFDKINTVSDSRYIDARQSHEKRVLRMKCELNDTYTFNEALKFARDQQIWAIDRSICFAKLENGKNIAILGFWYAKKDEVIGFRDVWVKDEIKPNVQNIVFLTEEEAKEIKDFTIYLYDYSFFYDVKKSPHVAKLHYSLVYNFDFNKDGEDLRLNDDF